MSDEDQLSENYRVMLQRAEHFTDGEWTPLPEEFSETGSLPSRSRLTELLFDNWRWFHRISTVGPDERKVQTTELSVWEANDWAISHFEEDETPAELIFADEFQPPRKVLLCDEQKSHLFDPRTGWRLVGAWLGSDYTTVQDDVVESTAHHPFYVREGHEVEQRPAASVVPDDEQQVMEGGRWVEAKDLRDPTATREHTRPAGDGPWSRGSRWQKATEIGRASFRAMRYP